MRKKGIFSEILRVVRSNLISLIFQVVLGIILAAVSMGAGIVFLYLLAGQQQENEAEESY